MRNQTIRDLFAIRSQDNGEPLVKLGGEGRGGEILVRKSVAEMMRGVQRLLTSKDPNLKLRVVEGYRHPIQQERWFLQAWHKLHQNAPHLSFDELLELVHSFVALPSIAGHSTGGAVDLTLTYKGLEIDMGGKIADFSKPERLPTYSAFVTKEQVRLHDEMLAMGFALFYGEWWHFSYGDREWAAFYDKPATLYSAL